MPPSPLCQPPQHRPAVLRSTLLRLALRCGRVPANNLGKGMLVPGSEVSRQADRIFRVLSVGHVKPGKGGAFVQAKLKCVLDGTIVPHKFRSAETVETVDLDPARLPDRAARRRHHSTSPALAAPLSAGRLRATTGGGLLPALH